MAIRQTGARRSNRPRMVSATHNAAATRRVSCECRRDGAHRPLPRCMPSGFASYRPTAIGFSPIPSFFILYRRPLYSIPSNRAACFRFQSAAFNTLTITSISALRLAVPTSRSTAGLSPPATVTNESQGAAGAGRRFIEVPISLDNPDSDGPSGISELSPA